MIVKIADHSKNLKLFYAYLESFNLLVVLRNLHVLCMSLVIIPQTSFKCQCMELNRPSQMTSSWVREGDFVRN